LSNIEVIKASLISDPPVPVAVVPAATIAGIKTKADPIDSGEKVTFDF